MQELTSRRNPTLQHVRKLLHSRSYRQACGQFAADGTKLFEEAARWCDGLEMAIVRRGVSLGAMPAGVKCFTVPQELMQWLSPMEQPQGVVFVCRLPQPQPLQITPGCLILDGIQDPGNVGTILRTADALEVPVILSDGCADAYNAKTVRAAMGAVFRTPPVMARREEILAACRQQGVSLAVTALSDQAVDIRQAAPERCAVVIGSEGQGVCEEYLQAAQVQMIIPMNARCESLNAAIAATIVMWQMRR